MNNTTRTILNITSQSQANRMHPKINIPEPNKYNVFSSDQYSSII
jgi:hypothetical protein